MNAILNEEPQAITDLRPETPTRLTNIAERMLAKSPDDRVQTCRELAMQFTLVGNPQIIAECKGFEDTRNWGFHATLDEAKASLAGKAAAPQTAAV